MPVFIVRYRERDTMERKHARVAAESKEAAAKLVKQRSYEQSIGIDIEQVRKA